jgi:hypothetical protein
MRPGHIREVCKSPIWLMASAKFRAAPGDGARNSDRVPADINSCWQFA